MNWNDLKKYSREELMSLVPDGFEFQTHPWTHQIASFIAAIANDSFLCALDLGTGKTKVAIDYCRYIDDNRRKVRAIVICLKAGVENFRDEVQIHSDLSAVCLKGSKTDKFDLMQVPANFFIINYEGLRAMLSMKVPSKVSNKNKLVIDQTAFNRFLKYGKFNVLIIDESHLIKTPNTLNFRMARKIAKSVNSRLLLTGTPFGNTLLDVWAQYFVLDGGKTFDTSFTRFKNAYFVDKGYFGPVWKVTNKGEETIRNKMFQMAIRYREDEVDDLPEKVFRVVKFSLSAKQRDEYDEARDSSDGEIGSGRYHKYRKIASGVGFKKNPKLEMLWEIIEGILDKHKVVIFTEYIDSHDMLMKFFKKKKIKCCHLSGKTKNAHEQYTTFQKDPSYRIMVANTKSGSASINLFAATYCFHYELGGSVINYKQGIKRIHRGGQTQRCFFYTLLARGTVEVGMHRNLSNDVDAFTRIVDRGDFIDGK